MKRFTTTIVAALVTLTFGTGAYAQGDKTGITDTTIKIGMHAPLTGFAAQWGWPTVHGAQMVFMQANDAGGIHGRKFEFVVEDDQCDAQKSIAAAKKLIHHDKAFMVNGGVCSTATLPTRDEYIANKVPAMILVATMDKIVQDKPNDWVFRAYPRGSLDGITMAKFLGTISGVKRISIVGHTDEHANARYDTLIDLIKQQKLELVGVETVDYKIADATAQVLKVKDAKPDAIALVARPAEAAVFLRDAEKHGLNVPMVGATVVDIENLISRIGDPKPLQDFYVVSVYKGDIDTPPMKPWVDLLKKYFPGDKAQQSSFYATAGALAVVEAIKKAGRDLTREKLAAELRKIKDLDGGPMLCKVTFTADNQDGCNDQTMWTLHGGKIVNVGTKWKKM